MAEKNETVWIRGEGGVVREHDLPLSPSIAQRLAKGYVRRVNEDGSTWNPELDPAEAAAETTGETTGGTPPATPPGPAVQQAGPTPGAPPTEPPAKNANKAAWVAWAVHHPDESLRMAPDDADALTKTELVERYGADGQ